MIELTLSPGPLLQYLAYPNPERQDVTAYAERFLFQIVEIKPGIRLQDIFGLFEACPALLNIFQRRFAKELVAEARLGPQAEPEDGGYSFEHLRLRQIWSRNSATGEQDWSRFELCPMGPVLTEDAPKDGLKAGQRIAYSPSAGVLRRLLTLPLLLSPEVAIQEADRDAQHWHQEVATVIQPNVRLGELIEAIFAELSRFGGPAETRQFFEDLSKRSSQTLESARTRRESSQIDFNSLARAGDKEAMEALFDQTEQHSHQDVTQVLSRVADDADATSELEAKLPGIRVKDAFRQMTGRPFRKAFREAGEEQRLAAIRERMTAYRATRKAALSGTDGTSASTANS